MIVTTNDGQTLSGSPREIVHRLNTTSRSPAKSDRTYMKQVAQRMKLQVGRKIKCDNPKNFIAELIKTGMLTEETVS